MHTIGAFEAKTHFSSLLEEVEKGGQVVITKHGRPIAKLSPISHHSKASTEEAIQNIKKLQKQHVLGMDWKILRDEGRK